MKCGSKINGITATADRGVVSECIGLVLGGGVEGCRGGGTKTVAIIVPSRTCMQL